ncbi:hypothetical protein K3495_g897 [Podosphaera aphanis]|nr:hypothetical protein K3495_g897 [Podosphaera aphanis]
MIIDGFTLPKIPFFILSLGNQDAILGDGWMAHFDVLPDLRNRKLFWRTPPISKPSFAREIAISRSTLQPRTPKKQRLRHQADANRRDTEMAMEDKRRNDGASPTSNPVIALRLLTRKTAGCFANKTNEPTRNRNHQESPIERKSIRLGHIQQQNQHTIETDELKSKIPSNYHNFLDVFSKAASDVLPPSRIYDHKIELEKDNALKYSPLYNQSADELKLVKQYLTENLDKGWIEPSNAAFSSPILFVKKPNGGLRFCVDYRKLNLITKKDRYPLPLIDETLTRLNRAKIFTKLDIRQAFHRIRMDPASEELTTFRTRYGSYKYRVLPFGLTNGPATYQRYMNETLFDFLDKFCTVYLDDILIYSTDLAEHESHVKLVLQRLKEAGLQADIKKCEFHVKSTKYLGFIVGTDDIRVDSEKVKVIENWIPPSNVKSVQSFLGFCNFYRRFIRNYGVIAKPLNNLTRRGVEFRFTNECQAAFHDLKHKLINAPVLAHYNPEAESRLETDASDGVIAAVFSQFSPDNQWHPVAFFSKTMAPAELNYEIHDKEMLAIIKSLLHWRAELQGSPKKIEILSDHKALEYFMSSKSLNARQARWAETLSAFNFLLKYRSGKSNGAADALSRRDQDVIPQAKFKAELRRCTLLKPSQVELSEFELNINFRDIRASRSTA